MNFGTIGAGTIAQAVAGHLVSADQQVGLSKSRGPDTLGDVTAGLGPVASAGTVKQSAAADMVFLTVVWFDISTALADLAPWDGRVLVDATNQFARVDPIESSILGIRPAANSWPTTPGARVVKAFNTLFASYIAPNPHHPAARQILFYARDVAEAKTGFHKVFDDVGFTSIDIGGLRDGGRLMQVGGGPFSALHAPKED